MKKFKNRYRIESARLSQWDYGSNAEYFVTICTTDRNQYFGEIRGGIMHLSEMGVIAESFWQEIPQHFDFVGLGAYTIMPNHVHGIVIIDKPDCSIDRDSVVNATHMNGGNGDGCRDVACNVSTTIPNQAPDNIIDKYMSSISPKSGSLSTIIRSYKSAVTKQSRKIDPHFGWQSRYYDHIIRNPESSYQIECYIETNVENWVRDRFNNIQPLTPNI